MKQNAPLRPVLFIIILNLIIVVAEVIAGWAANSISLISDALHNLGDVLAVMVTFLALYLGAKKVSEKMTFGYHRAEMMAGFVNGLFLFVTMLYILYEAIDRLVNPAEVLPEYMMVVAGVALVANAVSAFLLNRMGGEFAHTHHHDHGEEDHQHDHHHADINIRSAYLHMLSDAFISLGVIAGGAAIYYLDINWIDPVLSILFSIYILSETVQIVKRSFFSLMDRNHDDLRLFQNAMESMNAVHSIHDLHLYRPSSKTLYVSAHIVFEKDLHLSVVEGILKELRLKLRELGATHVLLQPETLALAQEGLLCSDHA